MKRRIFAFIAAALMITSVAFAQDTKSNEDIMLISEEAPMEAIPSYISKSVIVTSIADGIVETTLDETKKDDPEYILNYVFSEDTLVYDGNTAAKSTSEVKVGDSLVIFTDSSSPATLSLPPTYMANIVVNYGTDEPSMSVIADTFVLSEDELVSAGNTLRVVLSDDTKVFDQDGKEIDSKDLDGKKLIVFYDMATMSLPPLTTPKAIVVVNEAQENIAFDLAGVKTLKAGDKTVTNLVVKEDGALMVPVRTVAEALGFTVEWDGNLKAVMINSGMFNFQIGTNSYVLGRMMPVELSAAPELIGDLTFVPFEYFTDILGAKASISGEEVILTLE